MRADSPELGEAGEKQWVRLRAQIELASSFWLGFVFSPSPRSVIVLRERAERLLRTQTQTLLLVRPSSPDELRSVLPYLLENPEPVRAGCTWIEAVRDDSPGAPEQPWTQAWDELFLRMNERRDALRARLLGGLVFAAPPGIKPRVRDAAPDLWSVRSLVIDFEPSLIVGTAMREPSVVSARALERLPAPDPELALAEAGRRTANGAEVSQALAFGQAAEGLLAEGRTEEARKAAAKARDLLRGEGGLAEARALAMLAGAEEAVGDPAAAADHVEQAIHLARGLGKDLIPFEWLDTAGRLAHARKDLAAALAYYDEAELIARKRWTRGGKAPETVRNLSISLDRVGEIRQESGDFAAAVAACDESLTLRRRLRELRGDTPEALRDLSVSLDRVGDLRWETGDLAAAAAAYEESLTLARLLRELQGDIPQALRDLSISLERVGSIRLENGDLAAEAAYEESLMLRRRLRELRGDTPEALRDLSISLNKLGDQRRNSGDLAGAAAPYEESLTLRRRLRELRGDIPESLRDISISLNSVGQLRRETGDLAAAAAAVEESLMLRRRLRQVRGDIPEALRDLTNSLTLVSDIRHKIGDLAGAAAAREELQALTRPKSAPRKLPKPRQRSSKAQPKAKRAPSR
jgi:tetratricopeptide (TPR) repeat protein